MKKVFFFMLLCMSVSPVFASPSFHGTHMPDKKEWHVGYESTLIVKRDLESDFGRFRSTMYLVDFSWGIFERICVDWSLGMGNAKLNPYNMNELDYDDGFAGRYGFRIRVIDEENNPFKLVIGFQHYCVHPAVQMINGVKRKVILDDWQGSVVGSYDVTDKFSPYAGIAFSEGDVIEWYGDDRKRRQSENSEAFGLILGLNYFLDQNWSLNLEGKFFDEKAVSFGFMYAL